VLWRWHQLSQQDRSKHAPFGMRKFLDAGNLHSAPAHGQHLPTSTVTGASESALTAAPMRAEEAMAKQGTGVPAATTPMPAVTVRRDLFGPNLHPSRQVMLAAAEPAALITPPRSVHFPSGWHPARDNRSVAPEVETQHPGHRQTGSTVQVVTPSIAPPRLQSAHPGQAQGDPHHAAWLYHTQRGAAEPQYSGGHAHVQGRAGPDGQEFHGQLGQYAYGPPVPQVPAPLPPPFGYPHPYAHPYGWAPMSPPMPPRGYGPYFAPYPPRGPAAGGPGPGGM
jgi:hypothetical protein